MNGGVIVATRDEQRAMLVPEVARRLRGRDFRTDFTQCFGTAARHTIIAALPDDPMGYVFGRLTDAGGSAVLAMPVGDQLEIALLFPSSPARTQVATEDDTLAEIHDDSEVAMLFQYLRTVGTAVVCKVAARLVADEGLQPV